jgi:hypothetical protein
MILEDTRRKIMHYFILILAKYSESGLFVAVFFIAMLICLEAGYWIGRRRLLKDPEKERSGTGVIEAAVFALLGLILAFSYGGAASRFEVRRQLIAEEANAIGTAYLRLDLLPANDQPRMREIFRNYLDSRIRIYEKLPDVAAALSELANSTKLQGEIWALAQEACHGEEGRTAAMLLLPAINSMIDITTLRTRAAFTHAPSAIIILLFLLVFLSSLLAGVAMSGGKSRNLLHMLLFAAIISITLYVILDLEYPRVGLIRLDAADQVMIQLRETGK